MQQPTSSSLGMGRASSYNTTSNSQRSFDSQSLIVGPIASPAPSVDGGRDTPATYNNYSVNKSSSASLSSLRDINSCYTTTMPRGPYLQRHFGNLVSTNTNGGMNDVLGLNNNDPPPVRPRKPPRLLQYIHRQPYPTGSTGTTLPSHVILAYLSTCLILISGATTVENTEYFSLPDYNSDNHRSGSTPSSSDYHSDTNDHQGGGGGSGGGTSSTSSSSPPRRVNYGYQKSPAPLPPTMFSPRKALVVYDYTKKTSTEVSLEKSQVVSVIDAKPGSDWWRVQDDLGRSGYYPAHYLRMVWSPRDQSLTLLSFIKK